MLQGMIVENEIAMMAMEQQAKREMDFWEGEKSRAVQYPFARANELARQRGERAPYTVDYDIASISAAHGEQTNNLNDGFAEMQRAVSDPSAGDLTARAADQAQFDMIDLRFLLSAPTPIANVYLVVIATIETEGQEKLKSFYQHVGRIDSQPRRIIVRRAGLPPGYDLKDVKVHLYARGQELASNASEKSAVLTAAQAREVLLLSDLSAHATESRPAQPVWSLAPPALLGADSAAPFDHELAITVDSDGRLLAIHDTLAEAQAFVDSISEASELRTRDTPSEAAKSFTASVQRNQHLETTNHARHVPAAVAAALQDMIFLPALDGGQPIVSTRTFNLASYFP